MKEYIKIETIFNRDIDGTKKLIIGDFRNKTLEYLKDNIFICTEKVDGTNIRVIWDGHKVTYAGRTDRAQIPGRLINYLNEKFGGQTNEELFEQKFGNTPVTLYGEGYGAGIQKGGGYRDDVSFILFDVMVEDHLWLMRESVEDIAQAFDIDVVPVILEGTLEEAVAYVKTFPKTTLGKREAPMEGLVCRPKMELNDRYGNRVIVKIKACDF